MSSQEAKARSKDLSYDRQVRRHMIRIERKNGASANEARRLVAPKILAIEMRRAELPPASPIDF